jgi:hypothetical protein
VGSQEGSFRIDDLVLRQGRIYRVVRGEDGPLLADVTDQTVSLDEMAERYADGDERKIYGWMNAGMPVIKLKDQLFFEVSYVDSWLTDRGFQILNREQPGSAPATGGDRYALPARTAEPVPPETQGRPRDDLDDWVSVATLIEQYKLPSRMTVYRWVERGMPNKVVGGMQVFRIADVEAWLNYWGYDTSILKAGKGLVRAGRKTRFRRMPAELRRRRLDRRAKLLAEQSGEKPACEKECSGAPPAQQRGSRRFRRRRDKQ